MKNKIETTDIYFCAALLALGNKLEKVDKSNPRHMKFLVVRKDHEFESDNLPEVPDTLQSDLEQYENAWVNATLVINAVQFKEAIQRMKSVIHSL